MEFNIVFNFSHNINILESVFLKYLPQHKFYILSYSATHMRFDNIKDVINYLIGYSNIYFYKHVFIQLLFNNHIIFTRKINLFRNLMYFDNYLTNLLENFAQIKLQNTILDHDLKNIINVTFKNFLNNEICLYIYKTYLDKTVIYIGSSNYSFTPFVTSSYLIDEIFTYLLYENDSVTIKFNGEEIYSLMYKNKENTVKSLCVQKLIPHIIQTFKNTKTILDETYKSLINHSSRIIQKQARKSLYNPEYKLCRSILLDIYSKNIV